MGQVTGQGAQIPLRGQDFAQARYFASLDRQALDRRFRLQELRYRLLALFRLQRTGAIDEHSAGLQRCDGPLQ